MGDDILRILAKPDMCEAPAGVYNKYVRFAKIICSMHVRDGT